MQENLKTTSTISAIKIGVIYFVITSLWIIFSDRLAALVVPDKDALSSIQTYKGMFFIVIMTALLFFERKKAEEKLQKITRQQYLLGDNLPQRVSIKDVNLVYTFCNQNFAAQFGLSPHQVIGKTDFDLYPINQAEKNQLNDLTVIQGDRLIEFDEEYIPENYSNEIIHKIKTPIKNTNGEITGLLNIFWDVTEQRKSAEKLRVTNEFVSALLENAPIPIYVFDLNNCYLQCNQPWEEILGKTKNEIIGHCVDEVMPKEAAQNRKNINLQVLSEGKTITVEEQIRLNNIDYCLETVKFPLRDNDGQIYAIGGVSINITLRKKALKALEELNSKLEAKIQERTKELEMKNHELETFAYSVSHDLKAPLRGLDGYSKLLLEGYGKKFDEDGLHFLSSIRNAAMHMNQLIDDLLSYSRMERRTLQLSCINPIQITDQVIQLYEEEIEKNHISIFNTIAFNQIFADHESMSMAIRNLVDNAIKFSRTVEHPKIIVGGEEKEDRFVIWVQDNGPGFEEKYSDKIFEIFQRLHRAEEYPGTGIGLAIVRKAMERIGGKAYAESSPGKGATFFLEVIK
jgi:PAS domain S-box-containing protein